MMCRLFIVILGLLIPFLESGTALANWTLNLGYHNPPGASIGVNFLYFSSANVAFELGIGWVDLDSRDNNNDPDHDDDTLQTRLGGDANFKYLFSGGDLRPYLQAGIGLGISTAVGDDNDAGAGANGLFAGLGLMLGSPKLYVYGSFNLHENDSSFLQAGFGFDI